MNTTFGLLALVVHACVALAMSPPVFDTRPYAEAKRAAEDGHKWFVVKATAEWCGPCKMMDRTTWVDDKVVAWFKESGVVVAVDVDKEGKLAKDLSIEAMPTMIAFRDGKEFDRIVGYRGPEDFLGWLEGIARGEKSIDAARKKTQPRPGEPQNMQARLVLAKDLARSGKPQEAATEFVWLWRHMLEHDPAMYGVRLSFMASDMEELASKSDAAKREFTALRDALNGAIKAEKVDDDDLVDWVTLNTIIGDQKATLAWFDRVKDDKRWNRLVNRVSRDLEKTLIEQNRWADVGRLYTDPISDLERHHEILSMAPRHELPAELPEEQRQQIQEISSQVFREQTARTYAALLAAGRDDVAARYAARARELDTSPKMAAALAEQSLSIGQARADQIEWLAAAAKKDPSLESLRARVEAAAKKSGDK